MEVNKKNVLNNQSNNEENKKKKCAVALWWRNLGKGARTAICILGGVAIATAVIVPTVIAAKSCAGSKSRVPQLDSSITNVKLTYKMEDGNMIIVLSCDDGSEKTIAGIENITIGNTILVKDVDYTYDANSKTIKITKEALNKNAGAITIKPIVKGKFDGTVTLEEWKQATTTSIEMSDATNFKCSIQDKNKSLIIAGVKSKISVTTEFNGTTDTYEQKDSFAYWTKKSDTGVITYNLDKKGCECYKFLKLFHDLENSMNDFTYNATSKQYERNPSNLELETISSIKFNENRLIETATTSNNNVYNFIYGNQTVEDQDFETDNVHKLTYDASNKKAATQIHTFGGSASVKDYYKIDMSKFNFDSTTEKMEFGYSSIQVNDSVNVLALIDGTNASCTYDATNKIINITGNITANSKIIITVSTIENQASNCVFYAEVKDKTQKKITLNKTSLNMTEDGVEQLTATTNPSGLTVTWATSNDKVATVDSTGKITALAPSDQSVTITATADGESATCVINSVAYLKYDFATCNWSDISKKCNKLESGTLTEEQFIKSFTYNGAQINTKDEFVGKTRDVKVNNQTHKVRVIDIQHADDLLVESSTVTTKKAALTFEFANVICDSNGNSLTYQWNDAFYNSDCANYDHRNSTLRYALTKQGNNNAKQSNNILAAKKADTVWDSNFYDKSVLSMLPSDLQGVLKTVQKSVGVRAIGGDNYVETKYQDSLFIQSSIEMGFTDTGDKGCGTTYHYYTNSQSENARRVKGQINAGTYKTTSTIPYVQSTGQLYNNDVTSYAGYYSDTNGGTIYWTRGPRASASSVFGASPCTDTGFIGSDLVNSKALAVAPCFCI